MSQIQVSNLTFTYEGSYDAVFQDVSFQIDTDWKLGLIGRNGRGKNHAATAASRSLPVSGNDQIIRSF